MQLGKTGMKIIFVTTCKGRLQHIRETLGSNMFDNPDSKFVLLDYNSTDGLFDYVQDNFKRCLSSGSLAFYQFKENVPFQMSHAKNMAHRCAILEGADVLVTMDADNFAGIGFDLFVAERMGEAGVFLCPDFPLIKSLPHGKGRPQRGYAGRLAIRAQDFIKAGGYNETFDTWRGEDIDLIARMQRMEYKMRFIDNRFLDAIPHSAEVRFKEYPHAQAYETKGEWKKIYDTKDTVVNYGNIGVGTVYRNFSDTPIVLDKLPTRIFGIGLHKTATTSLHEAFKILGFDSLHWGSNKMAFRIWNEMNSLGRSVALEKSYSACDLPIPMVFKQLDKAYPGSKFILTIRDEGDWLKSVENLWNPKTNPFYDWDKQPFSHQIHEALYGRRDFDAATFLERYRRHNAEVMEYFKDRRDDLLVMNMSNGAGWQELCGFLKKPIPNVRYPKNFITAT
jgi:Sulfotransferase domain/N-terminal domain of galactosyltransferase